MSDDYCWMFGKHESDPCACGWDSFKSPTKALRHLIGYALTCKRNNEIAWMDGLAERINHAANTLGDNDRCSFNGDEFLIAHAPKINANAPDAPMWKCPACGSAKNVLQVDEVEACRECGSMCYRL